jgi:uncharacterized membrane protein YdjX (TVP38/TMEM64 family)
MEQSQAVPVTEPPRRPPGTRWAVASALLAVLLGLVIYLVFIDAPIVGFVVRLYRDKHFLKKTVASWGWAAPMVFVAIQALQVIISPFPGEITGPVGGALFGTTWGLIYSSIGLTIGTLVCFVLGRKWGEPLVRPWLSERNWNRLRFIVEAEGAIICFILYVIPGFPKDIVSYLFGISPIPFWLFAVVSTAGRLPGTWISSYFGAHVGDQQYVWALVFIAFVAAICLPIYYYRERLLAWLRLRARLRRKGLTRQREAQ